LEEKDAILKYLADTNARFCEYHDHKENSAWAATAAFFPLLAFLISVFEKASPAAYRTICFAIAGSIILLVYGYIFYIFIEKQLTFRRFAASVNNICFRWIAQILKGERNPAGFSLDLNDLGEINTKKIKKIGGNYFSLPKSMLSEAEPFDNEIKKTLIIFEFAPRLFIFWSLFLAIVWIWLPLVHVRIGPRNLDSKDKCTISQTYLHDDIPRLYRFKHNHQKPEGNEHKRRRGPAQGDAGPG